MQAESEIQDGGLDFYLPLASHVIKNSVIEFLDLEIMGIAVGIAQLYCIQAEIQVLPLASHNMGNRSAEFLNCKIHVYSLWNCAATLYTSWHASFSVCAPPSWISDSCSLALHSMGNSFIEFINLENIGVVIGILQLCCIQAGIQVFMACEPPSWNSYFLCITQYGK